jgi:hypothetical protein
MAGRGTSDKHVSVAFREASFLQNFCRANLMDVILDDRPFPVGAQRTTACGIPFNRDGRLESGCLEPVIQAANSSEKADGAERAGTGHWRILAVPLSVFNGG